MHERNRVTYEQYVELIRKEVEKRTSKDVRIEEINKNNGLVLDGLVLHRIFSVIHLLHD